MESITSFLSPESTERGKAAAIDAAFSSLRAAGANAAVEEFYPKIVAAIKNKNLDEFDALGERVLGFATKNMDVPVAAREGEDQSNVARSIEQLVSVADSRNIAIPPAILNDAANAFVSKDQGAVAALANSIGSLVDAGMKVQQDEQKKQTQLTDGSIVLIGSQSGTRYDNMGNPIPSGNKNAEVFSGFAEKSFAPTRDVMASVPGLGDVITTQVGNVPVVPATQAGQIDIGANPEAYAATQVPDFTSTQLKEQAIAEARDLYDQGNPVEAAQKLNAFGIRGTLGGAVSPNELLDLFGERRTKETSPTPETPAANFDSLSPEKKREYLDSLTPEKRQEFLNQRLKPK